jgi:two-component system cell cycle sensor histidine kinase/response regulator CckA
MPAGGERELTASLYVSRISDEEGDVTGLVMHVIDTTEQKNLEVQFNQAQKMQAVGQLAGGVAHDFNNLLTAMGGFCDLLLGRHGPDDPSFADIMQIKQNANRAGNLVRQLLAFSRRQTLQPKVFAITDALNDLSNLLRRLIGENIELELNHGKDVDLIRTDPGQFDQVIINLAVNSRDAMPGGGVINVTTERVTVETSIQRGHEVMPAGEYILIKVVDTGSGIAKEDISHIFEPFFSTKDVGEGTGLGLSTVYGIIRQSEGFIFVDSALGEGTTFSIYLPAFSAAEADFVGSGYANEIIDDADLTGAGTVLLVEDEDAVRLFGARALRNKGYRVLEANDGEHALDVINEFGDPIDLILTDVMMPGMDGHTLVRLILKELPNIKVILMSGYAEDAIPGEISEDQSINFLPKPFSLQELAVKVKDVLAE